jgi:thiamine-phosphate pyrophosphorylase
MTAAEIAGLYLIADPEQCGGRDVVEVVRLALRGGAGLVQYRDKLRDKGDQLPVLERLLALCREAGAPLLVNDHVDLALAVGADGVHVGQHDLPVPVARRLLPAGAIVGCSTNNPDEARAAEAAGATYIAVGRIFPTRSKANTRPAALETVRLVKDAVRAPVVAIGGINAENVDGVIEAGADAAAVIAAVCGADDVEAAARAISSRFRRPGGSG